MSEISVNEAAALPGETGSGAAMTQRFSGLLRLYRCSNWIIRICFVLALGLFSVAILSPWLAPHPPNRQKLLYRLRPPVPLERSLSD